VSTTSTMWIGFHVFLAAMLALDLGVFHRKSHVVSVREGLIWSAVWIVLAMLFSALIYFMMGAESAMIFLTGYLIEKSLSIDNVFVFTLIFSQFGVPAFQQHRVLFWGVLGAILMRAAVIFAGVSLVSHFHWLLYVFGGLLVFSGIKMLTVNSKPSDFNNSRLIKTCRRLFRVSDSTTTDHFFVRTTVGWAATRLFLVLLFVELSDLIFAVDSIPAIMAITLDPFLVYTSNVFAMLGLRSLYFALSGLIPKFEYLHHGLSAILIFVGGKMLSSDFVHLPTAISLSIITAILVLSICLSIFKQQRLSVIPSVPRSTLPNTHP
jgi:tellurite resistance protein TerC